MADQLTLSQPGGGGTLSPLSITCPPGFSGLPTTLYYLRDNDFPCAATLVEWISKLISLCTLSK